MVSRRILVLGVRHGRMHASPDISCCDPRRLRRSPASSARPRFRSHPRLAVSSRQSRSTRATASAPVMSWPSFSAIELTAAVAQARAALDAATANRNNVYAGVRAEQVATLAAEIAKAKSRLEYAEQQLSRTATLARSTHRHAAGTRPDC